MTFYFDTNFSGAMAVFWISLAAWLLPWFGVAESYIPIVNGVPGTIADGYRSAGFNSSLAIWLVSWGLIVFIMLVCSIKTNLVLVILFAILDAGLFIFAASHFQVSYGNLSSGEILQKVSLFHTDLT